MKGRSSYYQTVSRTFLRFRGAPYVLTPKEIEIIRKWEKEGIPLRVVLEGIKAFFSMEKSGRRRLRLTSCQAQVRSRFDAHKERRIGQARVSEPNHSRKQACRSAVEQFLANLPRDTAYLQDLFEQALLLLNQNPPNEEALEELDEKVEALLSINAPENLRKDVEESIQREYDTGPEDQQRLIRIELSRILRSDHRIPFLAIYMH